MRRTLLLLFLLMFSFMPMMEVKAEMMACDATDPGNAGTIHCDDWIKADDGTPNLPNWVEGEYLFQMHNTNTIQMTMSWAMHEFAANSLGFSANQFSAAISPDFDETRDGLPADLLRQVMFMDPAGTGTTVESILIGNVNTTIQDLLSSGFGTVSGLTTDYVDAVSIGGQSQSCSKHPYEDSQGDTGYAFLDNDAFNPPICFSTTATVQLDAATVNFPDQLGTDLERSFRGLLKMGTNITTDFSVFSDVGHMSTFVIEPPSHATVIATDGTIVARAGPPAFQAAEWVVDATQLSQGSSRMEDSVWMKLAHRETDGDPMVDLSEVGDGISIDVILDMRIESRTTVDVIVGISHIDGQTMSDWGISFVEDSDKAEVPWVTADGIRLAEHNDLVNLSEFTSRFPLEGVGDAIADTLSGGDIEMGSLEPMEHTDGTGITPEGGLNFVHTNCADGPESYYCTTGEDGMNGTNPVYFRATSDHFDMSLLNMLKSKVDDDTGFLEAIQNDDLNKLLKGGLIIEAALDADFLGDMLPPDIPPANLKLELKLPNWAATASASPSIFMERSSDGITNSNLTIGGGPNNYDWRHSITENGEVICSSSQKTCVDSVLDLDFEDFSINEWSKSVSFTASLDASMAIHRIIIPDDIMDKVKTDSASIDMDVLPSDLLRLVVDIGGSMDEPFSTDIDIFGEEETLTFTEQGLKNFATNMGDGITKKIRSTESSNDKVDIDLSGFSISFEIDGIHAPGNTIGDSEALSMAITIPTTTFTLALAGDIGGDNMHLTLTAEALRDIFLNPLAEAARIFGDAIFAQLVSMSGITLDQGGTPISVPITGADLPAHEESGLDFSGDILFTMPDGIYLIDLESTSGNIETDKSSDGRQIVKYKLPDEGESDNLSFRLQVSWWFILGELWGYLAIVVALITLLVMRRKSKKRKKAEARLSRTDSTGKWVEDGDDKFIDDDEFSSLFGEEIHTTGFDEHR